MSSLNVEKTNVVLVQSNEKGKKGFLFVSFYEFLKGFRECLEGKI
jgi:hypothetical protein